MARLEDYTAFVAIVDHGSLTAAARRLGRSLQAVSHALASLESELGVSLVRRTTRRSMPTEAGLALHGRLSHALAEIETARDQAIQGGSVMAGRLRIAASTLFAPTYVVPAIAAFIERHPAVEIELVVSDSFADLVAEQIDVAIRIGSLPDSDLSVRRIGLSRRVVFAAPDYLTRHGRPDHPMALAGHRCVLRRTATQDPGHWAFIIDGRITTVSVKGPFVADSAAACNEAAALGLGIATAPLWQVRGLVEQGRVTLILTDYEMPPIPIQAVRPPGLAPARVEAFVTFLSRWLAI